MHIRKYDFNYGRRELLAKGSMMAGAGLLSPLWPLIAKGADISKAYPDRACGQILKIALPLGGLRIWRCAPAPPGTDCLRKSIQSVTTSSRTTLMMIA